MKASFVVMLFRILFAIGFMALSVSCGSSGNITQAKTKWEREGLKGKVKEYTIVSYNVEQKYGEDVKKLSDKWVSKYDDNGNLLEQLTYDENGTLSDKSIYQYKYDVNSNQIEQDMYNATRVLIEKVNYDTKGNAIKEIFNDGSGSTSTYDDNGNKIAEVSYDTNGNAPCVRIVVA